MLPNWTYALPIQNYSLNKSSLVSPLPESVCQLCHLVQMTLCSIVFVQVPFWPSVIFGKVVCATILLTKIAKLRQSCDSFCVHNLQKTTFVCTIATANFFFALLQLLTFVCTIATANFCLNYCNC